MWGVGSWVLGGRRLTLVGSWVLGGRRLTLVAGVAGTHWMWVVSSSWVLRPRTAVPAALVGWSATVMGLQMG